MSRGGRDGSVAYCVYLYNKGHEWSEESALADFALLKDCAHRLVAARFDYPPDAVGLCGDSCAKCNTKLISSFVTCTCRWCVTTAKWRKPLPTLLQLFTPAAKVAITQAALDAATKCRKSSYSPFDIPVISEKELQYGQL